ncbi:unnamed protein product [Lactuca virosa]|uniref:Reverse transcriptase zinc-binding domain-containing protein n=1 Tax=Lactuca virosa TaxID=75947 RepID=A0AAU9N6T8_9ASTR|nr:unnamed protein product [Lactuca virosa]
MRYLGIPLISTRLFVRDCKRLVDKVRSRISDWRNKFLSYAGRLQLISSVLYSIPVYWASCLLIPAETIKEIEKMMKNFLWNCDESKKGRAKIAWSTVYWISLIPQFNDFQLHVLDPLVADKVLWRKRDGKIVEFDIQHVWNDLREDGQMVPWVHLVWFKQRIQRHSFILWLAIHERLNTQDRMRFWDSNKNLNCSLCNSQPDSHSHLFFEFPFSSLVWKEVKDKVEIKSDSFVWRNIVEDLQLLLKGKNIRILIMKIAFAASVYNIWRERNSRLFKKGKNMENKVILNFFEEIRLKLIGLKGGFLSFDDDVKRKWGIPVGEKVHDVFDD